MKRENEPLRCKQCGGVVEEERRCYATPVCFACLPPPKPLPIAKFASAAKCAPPRTRGAEGGQEKDHEIRNDFGTTDGSWMLSGGGCGAG
jgi:hypothetical protein